MNKSLVLAAIVAAMSLAACGKKEEVAAPAPAPVVVTPAPVEATPAPAPAADASAPAAMPAAEPASAPASEIKS